MSDLETRTRRTAQRRARLGGRSERVVRDVLQATAAELARLGYAALRVEDVATRAGVNKTTVYRRWPTKPELVSAALRSLHDEERVAPDTGALASDLLALLRERITDLGRPEKRGIVRVMVTEIDDPEVAAIARELREENQRPWLQAVARAVERGELPEETDGPLVAEMITGVVFARVLRGHQVDEAFARAVVDVVVAGAKAGAAQR